MGCLVSTPMICSSSGSKVPLARTKETAVHSSQATFKILQLVYVARGIVVSCFAHHVKVMCYACDMYLCVRTRTFAMQCVRPGPCVPRIHATMSSKAVPCPCPFCKGKVVSVYVRREHVAKFCSPADSRA